MSEVKFALSMTDQLSAPVRQAASAVDALLGKLKAAQAVSDPFGSVGAAFGKVSAFGAQTGSMVGRSQQARDALESIDGKISSLVGKKIDIEFNSARLVGQTQAAEASIRAIQTKLSGLSMERSSLKEGSTELGKLEEKISHLEKKKLDIEVDIHEAKAKNAVLSMEGGGIEGKLLGLLGQKQAILDNPLVGVFGDSGIGQLVEKSFPKIRDAMGRIFGQGASEGMLKLAQGAAKADTALQGMGMSLGGVVAAGTGAAVVGIGAVVVAAGAAVAAIGALTYKFVELGVQGAAAFTKFAVSSLSFKENTMVAFQTLLGSQSIAENIYGKAVKFASSTPFETKTVVGAYQKLLVGGFKVDELETMMNAIGDTAAMKGMDPQVIDQMVAGFAKMKGLGKLTGEVLDMEAFQGISGKIKEELGLQLGKSSDEIAKMIGGGRIDAATAQKAILEVIRKTYSGGKLGGAMIGFNTKWDGIWSNIVSRPQELFEAAQDVKGGGLDKMFGSLKDLGKVFADSMDPTSKSGQKITAAINSIGDTLAGVYGKGVELAKVFWKSMEGSTGDKILGTFRDVGAAIKAAFGNIDSKSFGQWVDKWLPAIVSGLGGFAKGLSASFGKFAELMKLDTGGDPEQLAKSFAQMGEDFGKGIGDIVFGIAAVTGAFGTLVGVLGELDGYWQRLTGGSVVTDMFGLAIRIAMGQLAPFVDLLKGAVSLWEAIFGKSDTAGAYSSESSKPTTTPTTSPTTVVPSGMDRKVQGALDMTTPSGGGAGNKTQNNTISVQLSGVGLDLSQLADMIKRGVTDAMLQVVPA